MAESSNLPAMKEVHRTINIDARDIWYRFQRVIEETMLSTSGDTNAMRQADLTRLQANMKSLRAAADVAIASPEIDTPYTTPREAVLNTWFDENRMLENDDLDHIKVMLVTARDELALSAQSNRIPNGLHRDDGQRLLALLDRIDLHVSQVTMQNNPMDYPETSPTRAAAPAGRTGI